MLFTSVLGGMLISMNIVEEKVDKTVSALNVTLMSRFEFILGKSLMGVVVAIFGSYVLVLITGFRDISFAQLTVAIMGITLISVMVGFIQGLNSDDVMVASIAAIEVLSIFWQRFFYPIPYYWSYKSISGILSNNISWGQVLGQAGIVVLISALIAVVLVPRICRGLE